MLGVAVLLLVPGYGGLTTALDVLADALHEREREATVVELAGDSTGDLDEQAGVLDKAVILAMQRAGARSVDVVGYSAGGVTVGSPHRASAGPGVLAAAGFDLPPPSAWTRCSSVPDTLWDRLR